MRRLMLPIGLLALLTIPSLAEARGPWGPGGGRGRGGPGKMFRCGRALMHAHPDVLKAQLGLTGAQLKTLQAVRTNFFNKRVDLRAAMGKEQIKLRALWDADVPNEGQVLAHMRKVRGLRGKLHEERVKAQIKVLRTLTMQQRTKLRANCAKFGPGGGRGFGGPGCPNCPGGGKGRRGGGW